jgi:hypothetical protein
MEAREVRAAVLGPECRDDLRPVEVEALELELDPLEEDRLARIAVLIRVDDVAVVPVHPLGHRGHEALLVGAREQQRRCSHCPSVLPLP